MSKLSSINKPMNTRKGVAVKALVLLWSVFLVGGCAKNVVRSSYTPTPTYKNLNNTLVVELEYFGDVTCQNKHLFSVVIDNP